MVAISVTPIAALDPNAMMVAPGFHPFAVSAVMPSVTVTVISIVVAIADIDPKPNIAIGIPMMTMPPMHVLRIARLMIGAWGLHSASVGRGMVRPVHHAARRAIHTGRTIGRRIGGTNIDQCAGGQKGTQRHSE